MNSSKQTAQVAPAKKTISYEEAQDAMNEILLTGESKTGLTEQEIAEILSNAPTEALQEMTGEYFDFSIAGEYNFKVTGLSTQQMQGKSVEVAELTDLKTNQRYVNGSSVLVGTVRQLQQLPAFIRVIATGKKIMSGNKREYYDIRVFKLGGK